MGSLIYNCSDYMLILAEEITCRFVSLYSAPKFGKRKKNYLATFP